MNEIYYRTLPATNLVNVQWAGGDIASLFLTYSRKFGHPAFTLHSLPFPSGSYNPFAFDLRVMDPDIPGAIPPYVDPISDDMMGKLFMWNGEPKVDHVSDIYRGFATLFFNVGKIRAENPGATEVTFMLNTPAGSAPIEVPVTSYWVWSSAFGATNLAENQANPFTAGDLRTPDPTDIVSIPIAFDTQAEAQAFIDLGYNDSSVSYFIEAQTVNHFEGDNFGWGTIFSTYKDKVDFPVDEGSPGWPEQDAEHIFYESAGPVETGALPPYMVTYTLNLETLEVSAIKV